MMGKRCLICAGSSDDPTGYHPRCARKFFGFYPPPVLDLTLNGIREYAARTVLARITVPGVQKKLSLGLERNGKDSRFTIVGLWGNFILKPPVEEYRDLPQNENIVMRLAESAGIPVVPHALIRLASGELAFISRRIDRIPGKGKVAMEDFCQISGRLTEDKYKGSVERVGKLIRRYSAYPGLDAVDFFERIVFCFITGNADMHLKNYSLYETPAGMRLSPAYDLVATSLVIPDDPEESALTINGRKADLKAGDFTALGAALELPPATIRKIYSNVRDKREDMLALAGESFLSGDLKERLRDIINWRSGMFDAGVERPFTA